MQQPDASKPTRETPEHNLRIVYFANKKTGARILTVDYISPPGSRGKDHDRKHHKVVQDLLTKSDLLSGSALVRIRKGARETLYRVEKDQEEWTWEVITEQNVVDDDQKDWTPEIDPLEQRKTYLWEEQDGL